MAEMRGEPDPRGVVVAWLTHPVTCLALVLLLVNDHVLKAAWGNALTGKLSDFAWLLVAPPLLATLVVLASGAVRSSAPRAPLLVGASLGVTGAVFVLVKVTTVGATTASALLSVIAGPSVVLRDPTDLMALAVLWLGWRVARPTNLPQRSQSRQPGWRWMLMLPVAVFATAATSYSPPDEATQIAVLDDRLVVSQDHGPERFSWFVSTDGVLWKPASHLEHNGITAEFLAAGDMLEEVCVPEAPHECYRAGAGLAVERSVDGGMTWVEDWSVTGEELAQLSSRYQPRSAPLSTHGVAIRTVDKGFEVWAANGGDGLAVRHPDGVWERRGFVYRNNRPVVPLPSEPTQFVYPIAKGLPFGVLAVAAVCLIGSVGRWRRTSRAVAGGGVALVLVGAIIAVTTAVTNGEQAVVPGQEFGNGFIFGDLIIRGLVYFTFVLAAGLVVGGAVMLGRAGLLAPAAFSALGVALAAGLLAPVLAAVVSTAVVVAAVVVARRRDSWPRRWVTSHAAVPPSEPPAGTRWPAP